MKQVYRVLAYLVAAGVAVQAASISYGMFGLIKWIEGGGTLDQSTELTPALGGWIFVACHGWHFRPPRHFAAVFDQLVLCQGAGGIRWALIVLGVTVLQVALVPSPIRLPDWGGCTASPPSRSFDRNDGRHAHQPAVASKVEADEPAAAPASLMRSIIGAVEAVHPAARIQPHGGEPAILR